MRAKIFHFKKNDILCLKKRFQLASPTCLLFWKKVCKTSTLKDGTVLNCLKFWLKIRKLSRIAYKSSAIIKTSCNKKKMNSKIYTFDLKIHAYLNCE